MVRLVVCLWGYRGEKHTADVTYSCGARAVCFPLSLACLCGVAPAEAALLMAHLAEQHLTDRKENPPLKDRIMYLEKYVVLGPRWCTMVP